METLWLIRFFSLGLTDTPRQALLSINYSLDDNWFDYYEKYSPYRGCTKIRKSELNNIWEDTVSVLTWETCRDHCFYYEYTIAFLFDGDKCGCRGLSGFNTELVNRRECSLPCSGSFIQQCGGPATDVNQQMFPATQVQVCDPGYYGASCAFPCSCKWLYPCDVITGECGNGRMCARSFVHYPTSTNAFRCDQEKDSDWKIIQFLHNLMKRIVNFFTQAYEIPEICPNRHYGIYCLYECHCKYGRCDRISGVCLETDCTIGWLGGRCDKGDSCISIPCRNGGECERSSRGYSCRCVHGYTGRNCHIVDPCVSAPCQNGGSCFAKDELYECTCLHPFSGSICTLDYRDLEIISDYLLCGRSGDPALGESYDMHHRMAGDLSSAMTIQHCVRYCRIKNFNYAGLHAGNSCFCGNSYNSYGSLPLEYCDRPCSGNVSQTCGSSLTISIHSTCPLGSYKMDCKLKCNCLGLMVQCDIVSGKCPNDLCAFGFAGDHCDQIITSPAITMNMIMLMYQMTLVLFPVLGIYSTLQTMFRLNRVNGKYKHHKRLEERERKRFVEAEMTKYMRKYDGTTHMTQDLILSNHTPLP